MEKQLQRRGIGKKLFHAALDHFNRQGFEGVFVQADKADDYAVRFYQQTNPSQELDVNHFFYAFNHP